MIERAYTVKEIIRMRVAVFELSIPIYGSTSFVKAAEVESQLLTYMTAGVSPEELETEAETHTKYVRGMNNR